MAESDNERTNRLKTVPVTVLFADIVDSIDLYARLGNEAAKQLIDGLFNDLSHLVAGHRGGVFVLTDTSLNGTYVALGGSDYFRVKLPFTLESAGQVIFGYPPAHPHQIVAAFEVL